MRTLPVSLPKSAPVIRNLVTAPVPTDKVERHLVTQEVVREMTHALNVWAYTEGR
jgi:hypothetical protein